MAIDEKIMEKALALAKEAYDDGEVPVGCIITNKDGDIIGSGRNRREKSHSACAHAEVLAIEEACKATGSWKLENCTLYVSLEPCPMCAGAIINSRIPTIVFGAKDSVTGSCGSVINLFEENYGHHPAIYGGIKAAESEELLKNFFKQLRK